MDNKVTVLVTGRGVAMHRATCSDLTKGENKLFTLNADTFDNLDLAVETYLDTGDIDQPGWLADEMYIYPCTGATDKRTTWYHLA